MSEIRKEVAETGTIVKDNVAAAVTLFSAVIRGLDPRIHAESRHVRVLPRVRLC